MVTEAYLILLHSASTSLQLTGGYDFMLAAFSHIRMQCIQVFERNITLLITEDPDELKPPEFIEEVCLDDCNNNGECKESMYIVRFYYYNSVFIFYNICCVKYKLITQKGLGCSVNPVSIFFLTHI